MSTYTTSLIDEPPLISLNTLTGENSYRAMRVKAYVRKNMVHTLVDYRSTHNFLDWNIARKFECKLRKMCPLEVSMENGMVMCNVEAVLKEFKLVFDVPKELPPKRTHDHMIPLVPNTPPVNIRPYKHPPSQKDAIELMLKELLDSRVIRNSQSPFSSPIVMVKKKDGTWRMCVDYRKLNKAAVKEKFLILIVEELIDELSGSKFFSKLDLRFRYHQIRMEEGDVSKCVFAATSVEYLGHIISRDGVATDPSKVQAMKDWPVPKNIKQLRGFLGLTSYYRKFIKDYAMKSKPLIKLLKKNAFQWSQGAQTAFDGLKLQSQTYKKDKYALVDGILRRKGKIVVGNVPQLKSFIIHHYHADAIGGHSGINVILHRTMKAREEFLQVVKFHLKRAQDRMVNQANKHRSDKVCEVGLDQLLTNWSYPYTVKGISHKIRILPHCGPNGVLSDEPVAILGRRLAKVGNRAVPYVLIKWSNHSEEDATWENYADLIQRYPEFETQD
nr:reverse transcriptase [Tanacetum cinerariifolium]